MSDIVDDFALVAASADALLKPIKDAVAALDVVLRQRSSAYRAGYGFVSHRGRTKSVAITRSGQR